MRHHRIRFIGVDLAWKSSKNHSCVAALEGDARGAQLLHYSIGLYTPRGVQDCILDLSTENTVAAIDAPLIIKNKTGQRPCEKEITSRFGRYHAGAHPSNLSLYPEAESVRLAADLRRYGFSHEVDPERNRRMDGRLFLEIYPHAAQVVLFDLPRIIKYKRGSVAEKKAGLARLGRLIWERLGQASPPLLHSDMLFALTHRDLEPVKGAALKRHEDALDAVFGAYVALFYWTWGAEKNEMIGDLNSGYIVVPTSASG